MWKTWGMERRSSYFPKMAIGNGIMRSRRPWVNLFHSPPDQAKSKKSQGNPEMQSKSCRNDGRLVYGARRRTSYSSGRRPCRHRTHWAVRAPDFFVVFFYCIFPSYYWRNPPNLSHPLYLLPFCLTYSMYRDSSLRSEWPAKKKHSWFNEKEPYWPSLMPS